MVMTFTRVLLPGGHVSRRLQPLVGVSVSGMKSGVQRGRAQLRELFDRCREIAVDARGKPTDEMFRCGRNDNGCVRNHMEV